MDVSVTEQPFASSPIGYFSLDTVRPGFYSLLKSQPGKHNLTCLKPCMQNSSRTQTCQLLPGPPMGMADKRLGLALSAVVDWYPCRVSSWSLHHCWDYTVC